MLVYVSDEDDDAQVTRLIAVPIGKRELHALETGSVTVFKALDQSWVWAIDEAYDGQITGSWVLADGIYSVPSDARPTMSYRLTGGSAVNDESIESSRPSIPAPEDLDSIFARKLRIFSHAGLFGESDHREGWSHEGRWPYRGRAAEGVVTRTVLSIGVQDSMTLAVEQDAVAVARIYSLGLHKAQFEAAQSGAGRSGAGFVSRARKDVLARVLSQKRIHLKGCHSQ